MMKKRLVAIALSTLLLLLFTCPAAAAALRVDDEASLLFDYEITVLENKLAEISDQYGVDIVIVTADSLGGKSAADFADDYYDLHGFKINGILLLVALTEREWFVSTAGTCINSITDDGITYISDAILPYLSDGDYYEAFRTFAGCCGTLLDYAENGSPYVTEDELPLLTYVLVSVCVGLITALIVTSIMKGKLKTIRPQNTADNYVREGSMVLSQQADLFLYSRVTRVAKPKDNGSKSGPRISSSGTSHGGRGGRF